MGIFDSLKKKAKEKVAKIGMSKEMKVESLIQKRLDTRRNIEDLKTSGHFKVDRMEDLLDDYEDINEDILDLLEDAEDLDSGLVRKLRSVRKEIKEDKKFITEMRKFLEAFAEKEEEVDTVGEEYLESLQTAKEDLEEELGNIRDGFGSIKESVKKSPVMIKESFDSEEEKLRDMASSFGISWETRKERQIRQEKEEIERLERLKRAEEEARRKAEAEAYFNKVRNNPAKYKDELLNYSFNLCIYADRTIMGVQEIFTHVFPYLRLGFYLVKTGKYADKTGGRIQPIDSSSKFSSVIAFRGNRDISISAKDTPAQIESRFRSMTGLAVKIEYNDKSDERFYISKNNNWHTKSLADISALLQLEGFERADIS